jgi:hypothetical protein
LPITFQSPFARTGFLFKIENIEHRTPNSENREQASNIELKAVLKHAQSKRRRNCRVSSNFAKRFECARFTAAFSTPTGLSLVFSLPQPEEQHPSYNQKRHHPPEPSDAARFDRLWTEFVFYEFGMVEIFVRQAEMAGIRGFRPAGLFIRAAFGTGFGLGRHFSAAVWTNVGGHYDLRFTRANFKLVAADVRRLHIS